MTTRSKSAMKAARAAKAKPDSSSGSGLYASFAKKPDFSKVTHKAKVRSAALKAIGGKY